MNWPPQSPEFIPLIVFGMCWKRLKEWFDSPVINIKYQPKMYITLDGNKCCGNNATANVLCNQSKSRSSGNDTDEAGQAVTNNWISEVN